jgi:hypothetical protein
MPVFNNCEVTEEGTNFCRKEAGKKFCLSSDVKVRCKIVNIDNCFFKDADFKRNDWFFYLDESNCKKAYYIELKGKNIEHACEQLYNGIDHTRINFSNFSLYARVIALRDSVPNLKNNEYYRKVKRQIKSEIIFCKVHKGNNYTYTEKV